MFLLGIIDFFVFLVCLFWIYGSGGSYFYIIWKMAFYKFFCQRFYIWNRSLGLVVVYKSYTSGSGVCAGWDQGDLVGMRTGTSSNDFQARRDCLPLTTVSQEEAVWNWLVCSVSQAFSMPVWMSWFSMYNNLSASTTHPRGLGHHPENESTFKCVF